MMHLNGLEKNLSSTSLEEMEEPEKEPIVYEDAKHTTNVLNSLRQMHKRGQFCDATLIVGEHELGIHRAVLAASSPYFFQLFESSDTDDSLRTFKLKGVQFERFKPLLDFMYTGRLQVAQDMVKAVYNLAQDLRIASASQACVEYLTTSLTPDNCLGVRSFASEETFRENVTQYISENILEVTNSKNFYGLQKVSLEIVVPNEHRINSASNEEVMEGVLEWLKEKLPDFKNKIEALSEDTILLYLNSNNTVTDCNDVEDEVVQENELVQDYKKLTRKKKSGKPPKEANTNGSNGSEQESACKAIYHKFSIDPYSPKEMEWSIIASYKTKDRSYMMIAMLNGQLVTVAVHYRLATHNSGEENGKPDPASPLFKCNGNDPFLERITDLSPLQKMLFNRCAFGITTLDGKIFVCGGYDRGECLKSTEVYDVDTNSWSQLGDMCSGRGRFSIGCYEDKIYAFGGSSGNFDMRTVECYDPNTRKWSVIAKSDRGSSSPGIAVLHGKLYVLGGCIGQITVATCQTLDLASLEWQDIAPMKLARYQAAVTIFRNKIYAVGGTNGWKCLSEVEVYDPEVNEWTMHSQLNITRRGAGIDVFQGKIYVVGGSDGTSALNSTEIYDPENHSWVLGPSLRVQRANCGVAVLNERLYALGGFNGKKFLNSIEYLDLQTKEAWRNGNTGLERSVSHEATMAGGLLTVDNCRERSKSDIVMNGGEEKKDGGLCSGVLKQEIKCEAERPS